MAWAQGRIYYNQKNASGVFDGWSANPDGSDAKCVTCGAVYPTGTQHGISDVTADGRYALATVERSRHWPVPDGMYMAAPGNGAYNDLWLQKSDGSQAWRLSNSITTGASALIWPRFDSTGTRVVWSEQWRWGMPYGGWRIIVADITWTNGVPSLTNKKTFQSTGFLEPYGFTTDGSRVLFAADVLAGTSSTNLQIMSLRADLTGTPVRLSPSDVTGTGDWSNYNEFAFADPGHQPDHLRPQRRRLLLLAGVLDDECGRKRPAAAHDAEPAVVAPVPRVPVAGRWARLQSGQSQAVRGRVRNELRGRLQVGRPDLEVGRRPSGAVAVGRWALVAARGRS